MTQACGAPDRKEADALLLAALARHPGDIRAMVSRDTTLQAYLAMPRSKYENGRPTHAEIEFAGNVPEAWAWGRIASPKGALAEDLRDLAFWLMKKGVAQSAEWLDCELHGKRGPRPGDVTIEVPGSKTLQALFFADLAALTAADQDKLDTVFSEMRS